MNLVCLPSFSTIDARRKPNVYYSLNIAVSLPEKVEMKYAKSKIYLDNNL